MRIRSVVGATVATTVAVLLAVSGLPAPVAAAALSLSVEPTEAPPGSMVRVSGGCTEGWSDSETGLRIAAETVSVDLVPIPLEEGNTFSSVPVTIPESMEPGEYRLYTACDAETPFTVLSPPPPPPPPPPGLPTLTVVPDSGHVGDTVRGTGTCPTHYEGVDVVFGDVTVGSVSPDSTGAFGPVDFAVPDIAPGAHVVTTTCEAGAPFEVLPEPEIRPTLSLDPDRGAAGEGVSASGTCPVLTGGVTLSFGDEAVGSADVDPETGAFAVDFSVPAVDAGTSRVTTDCAGEATFTVLPSESSTTVPPGQVGPPPGQTGPGAPPAGPGAPPGPAGPGVPPEPGAPADPGRPAEPPAASSPAPPEEVQTPDGLRIKVPDLTGLTEDEAVAALGDQLVLGNRTGRDGRIERQVPAPGALVEPASAVTVVLDEPAPNLLWLIVPAVLVLALAGGLVAERVRRRRVRERRWIEDQVRTDVRPQVAAVSDVPGHAVPGVDLRVEVHRHPARL